MAFLGQNMLLKMKIMSKILNILFFVLIFCTSCSVSKTYPKKYYAENEKVLLEIKDIYSQINVNKRLAIAFNDWHFDNLSLELKTDSIRYIYDFSFGEARINDTLRKFGFDTSLVQTMIRDMQKVKCTWINTLDFYVDRQRNSLFFMAVNAKRFVFNLKTKYYLFNFYKQPQYYDEKGRLLQRKKLKELRKINSEVFWRINDKVCYTISSKFR